MQNFTKKENKQNPRKYLHCWPTVMLRLSITEPSILLHTICVVWSRSFKTWCYFTHHLL